MKTILGRNIGGCVVDHSTTRNERQLDTIRVRVMERSIWRQGQKIVCGMRSEGSINFGIVRNYAECVEVCEVVQRVGNWVAEYGFEYFCLDYVSKIGVSVTERNICPACMRSASSPRHYCTRMFSAFDACSFCSALDFCCTYMTNKACMFCKFVYRLQLLSLSYSRLT